MGYILGATATLDLQEKRCEVFGEAHYTSALKMLCLLDRVEPDLFVDAYNLCMEVKGYMSLNYADNNKVSSVECYADVHNLFDDEEIENLEDDLYHIVELSFMNPDSEISNVFQSCYYVFEIITDRDPFDGVSGGQISLQIKDYGNQSCTTSMELIIRETWDNFPDDRYVELWKTLETDLGKLDQDMRTVVDSAFFYPNEKINGMYEGCWFAIKVTTNSTETDNISLTYNDMLDPDCDQNVKRIIKNIWNSIQLNEFDQKWEKLYEVKDF